MDEYQHLREDADAQAAIDRENAAAAIRIIARMLIERRELAERGAVEARRIARDNGWAYSLSAEQHEGAHAAYSVACAIVAGACRVASIDVLAADDPAPAADLETVDNVYDLDEFFKPIGERVR